MPVLLDKLREVADEDIRFADAHRIGKDFLGAHLLDALVLLSQQFLRRQKALRHLLFRRLWNVVAARLADGRNDLVSYPALEGFRAWQLRTEYEAVEARFIDEYRILLAAQRVFDGWGPVFGPHLFILVVNMVGDCISRLLIAKCHRNIFADEPRLTVDGHRAHLPELWIAENLQFVFVHTIAPPLILTFT